jgi:glycosyltransferase involved in cell wall biosynthesis
MKNEKWEQKFKDLKCCVVIPTYNNAGTLSKVIFAVLEYTSEVLVVNDGSTDDTSQIVNAFGEKLNFIEFKKNKGKGKALREGFRWALGHGYEYVISIDSDGQHFADDLPQFLDYIEQNGPALLIGSRNMTGENVPGKSSFGNNFSNFWFRVETGLKLDDTQSGFRMYPVKAMEKIQFFTRRFEFEVEVIVKAAWRGIDVVNVPVKVHYDPPSERVTHFRPFQDFTRISILNTYLVTLTLLYYFPRRFIQGLTRERIREFLKKNSILREEPTYIKAFSVGFGVFMGIFPIWGYQLIVGIALSHWMKLNKTIFVIAAHISIPPMIPIIVYGSYKLGYYFVENPVDGIFSAENFGIESIYKNVVQYLVGSIILAVISGIVSLIISFPVFEVLVRRKRKERLV